MAQASTASIERCSLKSSQRTVGGRDERFGSRPRECRADCAQALLSLELLDRDHSGSTFFEGTDAKTAEIHFSYVR